MAAAGGAPNRGPAEKGLPEDILLCIDVCEEMGQPWDSRDPQSQTRLSAIKQGLSSFVQRKSSFDRRHRFGVCLLVNDCLLVQEFTSDQGMILATIDSLGVLEARPEFQFDQLFSCVEKLAPPVGAPSSSVLRVLLVYGRSHAIPLISSLPTELLGRPLIFLDALYVHKKASDEGVVCQDIYDFLMNFDIDDNKPAYFFEVASSLTRLHQHMMMLLAHPAQRDDQDSFLEKLEFIAPDA